MPLGLNSNRGPSTFVGRPRPGEAGNLRAYDCVRHARRCRAAQAPQPDHCSPLIEGEGWVAHLLVPLTLNSSSGSSSATGAPKSTTKTGCNYWQHLSSVQHLVCYP